MNQELHPRLSIFTPTFNRAHTLPRLYDSLCAQKSSEIEWVVVDDGSTDSTRDLVDSWIKCSKFTIRYVFQRNLGMVAAHNTALDVVCGELVTCVDSDDYLADGAVQLILAEFDKVREDSRMGGIVGLDVDPAGNVIGDPFPSTLESTTFTDIRFRLKIEGDKKYVFRRLALEQVGKYPVVDGEHFPAVSYLYRLIDKRYRLRVLNRPLCVVDYQPDGNTGQKLRQYMRSPNAFMLFREMCMNDPINYREYWVSAVHFVAASIIARKVRANFHGPHSLAKLAVFPIGLALYLYILLKLTRMK